ncbi:hypothetical protein ACIBCD_05265 [Nocardia brasiliensis]|uniref:hypothetical protein n=1 Tax=Nocardia brasiliensis TaxID=37326 RepID=UPI002456F916|nr:hypothetical protein [Nocardia brasiliensis]
MASASDIPGTPTGWVASTAEAVGTSLAKAAASTALTGMSAESYRLEFGDCTLFGLGVRLGSAHRMPGWSTYAHLQVIDPDQPNLAILTILDRRDSDGVPLAGRRRPVYTPRLDYRLVRRFIPAARLALAELDPAGRFRSVVIERAPGRATILDILIMPVWFWLLFRSCAWRTQAVHIIVDFYSLAPVAKLMAKFFARHHLHLFPATHIPARQPMHLPAAGTGRLPAQIHFSTATEHGISTARRYLKEK